MRRTPAILGSLGIALLLAAELPPAEAQKRKQRYEPSIDYVFPAGGERGTRVEITLGGANLQGAHTVRVNGRGIYGEIQEVVNPKLVKAILEIAKDAPLGEREIRLQTPGGYSSRFRFFVGQLPEVNEEEPNSERDKPQVLPALPLIVNGQILPGDRDYYRFHARAGETLVARAEARRLQPFLADAVPGWADLVLTLYDSSGRELASVDDAHLRPDPVLIFKAPRAGDYVLEVRDVLYRGRADFVYRLQLGALPFITSVHPLGARRGTTARVTLEGVNLPQKTLTVVQPRNGALRRNLDVAARGIVSNEVPFAIGEHPEVEEREPNGSPEKAQRVRIPVIINGRIADPSDEDHFVFAAEKGQKLVLDVLARRLDSPLDSLLTLFGPKGNQVAENDDAVDLGEGLVTHHADSHLVYTIPVSGDYVVRIRDVQGKGGKDFSYRLTLAPVKPDFYLHISPDNPALGRGDTGVLTLTAVRKDGFAGEIAVTAHGLPPGFVAGRCVIPAGQNLAQMTLTAPPGATLQSLSPTIRGTATLGKDTTVREALPAEEMMQAFSYRHTVPTQELLLTIREAPPFTMSVVPPPGGILEIAQDGEAEVSVRVHRNEALPAPLPTAPKGKGPNPPVEAPRQPVIVAVGGIAIPPGITTKPAQIAPDGTTVTVTVRAAKNAPLGVRNLVFLGTTRVGRGNQTRMTPALPVRVVAAPGIPAT